VARCASFGAFALWRNPLGEEADIHAGLLASSKTAARSGAAVEIGLGIFRVEPDCLTIVGDGADPLRQIAAAGKA
jgi:hypothetical protein